VTRRLAAVLAAGFLLRAVYVFLQPRFDPTFAVPILDGAYYVEAARALAASGSTSGVYYMPPLYPWALSIFLRLFGDAWTVLFLIQQLAVTASAGALALVARRAYAEPAGDTVGPTTAALVLLYHPALFFASHPLVEASAMLLLAASVAFASREDDRSGFAAGAGLGLTALLRPNFLPLAPLWAAGELAGKRARRGALLVAASLLVLLPTVWHNYAAAPGRIVPVSANGGVVFWLGNAPGAAGVYTPAAGFTGSLQTQQREAIDEASARAGRALDAVESDGFWWREGLRARAADPFGTIGLIARRVLLTVDNAEHGLDYTPAIDANPLRFAAPVPFAVLLGLAVFGAVALGWTRTGGFPVWSSLLVAAAAPLVFYVSSRHRLPVAFLLCVPAGAGIAALRTTRRVLPYAAGCGALALSLAVPSADLMRTEKAAALSLVATAERKAGKLDQAAESARRATEIDPQNAVAWFNRGVIAEARGDDGDAERAYRAALDADPVQPDAAANLARILVNTGRPGEAPQSLERALAAWPRHAAGWTNLIVAYAASGDRARAAEAARRAARAGVALDPGLVKTVEGSEGP
jgi:tetratricopeptide (TPR) repeat protein